MKILKKSKAQKDAKLAAFCQFLTNKLRFKEKIDKLNQWADVHKKKVSIITISILTFSLVLGTWLTLTSTYNEADMLSSFSEVKPAFDGIHRIQQLKSVQIDQTLALTNQGKQLKHDLDSLVKIPVKSHKDSIDIMVKYRQLELVVKSLDNNTKTK